jgi:hypothetical protein
MGRSGTASLPLHHGKVPAWLHTRMATLGRVIVEAIAIEYGRDEVLRRLAHPHWFQCFGAVMGMDWHSSGITTSVIGALKRGLAPIEGELGLFVCGGRGNESRKTPAELIAVGERTGLDGDDLARTSRLVAKIDSAAVQDGFDLYLHGFVVAADGKWTVVQQGMNGDRREARRYHWLSEGLEGLEGLEKFLDSPHTAIDGPTLPTPILNVADARAATSRQVQLDLVRKGPDFTLETLSKISGRERERSLALPHLHLPAHHDVRREDVSMKRLGGALLAASERGAIDYEELLLTPGVGARTVLSLALVADVVHGAPSRFADPARHSLAHGGKDGHPYPVPLDVYDRTIRVMRDAVDRAKLGNDEKLSALRRLDEQARRLERIVDDVDFEEMIVHEHRVSPSYGGMTVEGPATGVPFAQYERARREANARKQTKKREPPPKEQLRLFRK